MNHMQQTQLAITELELAKIQASLTQLAANSPDLGLRDQLHDAYDTIGAAQDMIVALKERAALDQPSAGRIPPGEVARILRAMEAA